MSCRRVKSVLLAGSAAAVLLTAVSSAGAGGFALREQSAYGQGASFAGIAAGGSLSAMFWNPAIMTQFYGMNIEAAASIIVPRASHSYSASTLAGLGGPFTAGVDNSGDHAIVPATYTSMQINDRFWVGASVNAPFGLSVGFPSMWAGAAYAQNSDVVSYNFAPSVAYKINDMISVSAGLQVQYMKVSYSTLAALPANLAIISGNGYGYGFTLGATFTPTPTTVVGIGYRSAIDQEIDGTLTATTPGSTPGSVSTELKLPDLLTVGLRQKVGDRFTLLAGFEWAGWSRIGTAVVTSGGATATISGAPVVLPFEYSDSYFYSLGGEYAVSPSFTVRAGIAYEQSPVTDGVRTPRLPDNDRMWYSVGTTYHVPDIKGLSFDVGYSFIDVKNTPINLGPTTGNPWSPAGSTVYTGSTSSQIHILSFGFKYRFGGHAPMKTALVTK